MDNWQTVHRLWHWLGFPILSIVLFILSFQLTIFSPKFMDRLWIDLQIEKTVTQILPDVLEQNTHVPLTTSAASALKSQVSTALENQPITTALRQLSQIGLTWLNQPGDTALTTVVQGSQFRVSTTNTVQAVTTAMLNSLPFCTSGQQTDNCRPVGTSVADQAKQTTTEIIQNPSVERFLTDQPARQFISDHTYSKLVQYKSYWQTVRLVLVIGIILLGILLGISIWLLRQDLLAGLSELGKIFAFHALPQLILLAILRFAAPFIITPLLNKYTSLPYNLTQTVNSTSTLVANRFLDVSLELSGTIFVFGVVLWVLGLIDSSHPHSQSS